MGIEHSFSFSFFFSKMMKQLSKKFQTFSLFFHLEKKKLIPRFRKEITIAFVWVCVCVFVLLCVCVCVFGLFVCLLACIPMQFMHESML